MCSLTDSFCRSDELVAACYLDGIDFLMHEGADLSRTNSDKGSVLHTACCSSTLAVVQRLVESNVSLEMRDKEGWTPFFWTLDHWDKPEGVKIARYLQEQGADVTVKDKIGVGVIMWCMSALLHLYDQYCDARDGFNETPERVQDLYEQASSRLDMLEYLLTLEELDLDAQGRWRDARTKAWREENPFEYAIKYVSQDSEEMEKKLKAGIKAKASDEAAAEKKRVAAINAANKKTAQANRKRGAEASETAPTAAAAETTAAGSPSPASTAAPASAASSAMDDVPAADTAAVPAAAATSNEAAVAAAAPSSSSSASSPRKRSKLVHANDADAAAAAASSSGSDPTPAVPAASSSSSSSSAAASSSASSSSRYILTADHFRPRAPMSDCAECARLYAGETVPQACARLVYMELLRRATNEGDFGNESRVLELLAVRQKHPFLNRPLQYHSHPNLPHRVGPLHVACSYVDEGSNDLAILKALLSAKISDRTVDAKGYTPLHVVCELGDVTAVKLFLKERAYDASETGAIERDSCLMLCSDSQSHGESIARELLKHGAPLYARDNFLNTAFHWAVYKGNFGVLRVLLEAHHKAGSGSRRGADAGGRSESRSAAAAAATERRTLDTGVNVGVTKRTAMKAATAAAAAEAAAAKAEAEAAAAAAVAAPASSSAPSDPCSVINPFTSVNHWGNSVMHYACYKAFSSEGHLACLRSLFMEERVSIHSPQNGSGLVPRQVVAGYGSADLRGKRVLLLLNTRKWIEQPEHILINKLERELREELEKIEPLDAREKANFAANPATAKKDPLLRKMQKDWHKKNAELTEAKKRSLAALTKMLAPYEAEGNRALELAYTPPTAAVQQQPQGGRRGKQKTVVADAPAAAAAAAASDDAAPDAPTTAESAAPSRSSSTSSSSSSAASASDPKSKSARQPFLQPDVSHGREWTAIPLENFVDDVAGLDYKYITSCVPHPGISFPVPRTISAGYDPEAVGLDLQIEQQMKGRRPMALSAAQQAEARKFQQKQRVRAAAKAEKEKKRSAGRKSTKKLDAAAQAAADERKSIIAARTSLGALGAASVLDASDAEPQPGPRCDCRGPNACMDGSCACFRFGNEKLMADPTPSVSHGDGSRDALSRMGRLCGKLEQLCNCHELCGCRSDCLNRHIARGITARLCVYKTLEKGWACRAEETIKRGTFIVEYVGEIIGPEEAARRLEDYDKRGVHYVFGFRGSDVCIDPVAMGNVARTLNHSCEPNVTKIQVYAADMRLGRRFPKMAFFASREIKKGEEVRQTSRGEATEQRAASHRQSNAAHNRQSDPESDRAATRNPFDGC